MFLSSGQDVWNGHHSDSAAATGRRSFGPVSKIMQGLSAKMARAAPPQGDRAAHIGAFTAAIGCVEIIAKDPPGHQRILHHLESARMARSRSWAPRPLRLPGFWASAYPG